MFIWKRSASKDFYIQVLGVKKHKEGNRIINTRGAEPGLNLGMAPVAQEEQRNHTVRLKEGRWTEESVLPKASGPLKLGGKPSRSTITKQVLKLFRHIVQRLTHTAWRYSHYYQEEAEGCLLFHKSIGTALITLTPPVFMHSIVYNHILTYLLLHLEPRGSVRA